MKHLNQYINIRKGNSRIMATNETICKIVKEEIIRLGEDADLNHIDVSQCTDLSLSAFDSSSFGLFQSSGSSITSIINRHIISFRGDISKWDVSHVEDMRFMFYRCTEFNCDLSQWDVHRCKVFQYMFFRCKKFNSDLSNWNMDEANNTLHMFDECPLNPEFMPEVVRKQYADT